MSRVHTCPECGGHNFRMYVMQRIHVDFSNDDEPEVTEGPCGDMEWDDTTEVHCDAQDCGHYGPLGEMVAPADEDDDTCSDYFCLGADGNLWVLGNHGDMEAADDTARSIGVQPIWTFDAKTAKEWLEVLNREVSQ